jgi:hypothetical protein
LQQRGGVGDSRGVWLARNHNKKNNNAHCIIEIKEKFKVL